MAIQQRNNQIRTPPHGAFVPVPTFFKSTTTARQRDLDVAAQIEHALLLAKAGIHGLVLLGSTGEAIHLSQEERIHLVRSVREALINAGFNEYPIMAGILTNSSDDAIDELIAMKNAGADWGLVLVPGYFGAVVNQVNIIDWFVEVADASPMGVLIYNYPGVTNNVLVAPETYFKLAAHPKIVGCKMSHGNMSHHLQVSLSPDIDHSNFSLYSGFGQQLFPVVSCGGAGVIDGLGAVFPTLVATLFNEASAPLPLSQERLTTIQRLQWHVSRGNEVLGKFGLLGIREAAIRELGIGTSGCGRLPLGGPLPLDAWSCIDEVFVSLRKIEKELAAK